jgi:SAM-dependent methyltransferase
MRDVGLARLREDLEWLRVVRREKRPVEGVIAHYELERKLAGELLASTAETRTELYGRVYDRLFAELPDHPQWSITPEIRRKQAAAQIRILAPMIDRRSVFLEVGCGDAVLTKSVAPHAGEAIGVDVTDRLVDEAHPENFRLLLSDGVTLPVASNSVDLVLSNHLVEHMHEDDVAPQLAEILRVLKRGGRYACATPNRLNGPHDISVFFGYEPGGFHLREYDHRSLARTLRVAGFRDVKAIGMLKGRRYEVPIGLVGAIEWLLDALPVPLRRRAIHIDALYYLSQVMVVGRKPGGGSPASRTASA